MSEEHKVTDKMVTVACKRWPCSFVFDFIDCTNCGFIGLVQLGDEKCPECMADGYLAWADENQQEYNL